MEIKIPKNIKDMIPEDKVSDLLEFICGDEFTSKTAKEFDTNFILKAIKGANEKCDKMTNDLLDSLRYSLLHYDTMYSQGIKEFKIGRNWIDSRAFKKEKDRVKLIAGKHIVQLRNGEIGVVMLDFEGELTVINNDGNQCEATLVRDAFERYAIVKIGVPTFNADIGIFEKPKWEWEDDIEELTLKQVCKELGRDIKIVK